MHQQLIHVFIDVAPGQLTKQLIPETCVRSCRVATHLPTMVPVRLTDIDKIVFMLIHDDADTRASVFGAGQMLYDQIVIERHFVPRVGAPDLCG